MRVLVAVLGAAFCVSPIAVHAQQQAYKAPRNSLGQPDLEGFWTNATLTNVTRARDLGERRVHTPAEVAQMEGRSAAQIAAGNRSTDPNAPPPSEGDVGGYNRGWLDPGSTVMRVGGEPRTSFLTTPDGQFPARKATAAAAGRGGGRAAGGQYDNPERRPLGERCIISFGRNGGPPMLPNGFYNNNYQIVQSKDHVAIRVEMVHDTRIVRLNSKHRTDGVRPWFGDSIGWWEGETLVVETTNIPQRQAYQGSWENLKVVERFRRVAKNRLLYQFTIDDPTMWDKPWGGEYEFGTLDGEIYEYACAEGNHALEGILAGARQAEEAARQAAR